MNVPSDCRRPLRGRALRGALINQPYQAAAPTQLAVALAPEATRPPKRTGTMPFYLDTTHASHMDKRQRAPIIYVLSRAIVPHHAALILDAFICRRAVVSASTYSRRPPIFSLRRVRMTGERWTPGSQATAATPNTTGRILDRTTEPQTPTNAQRHHLNISDASPARLLRPSARESGAPESRKRFGAPWADYLCARHDRTLPHASPPALTPQHYDAPDGPTFPRNQLAGRTPSVDRRRSASTGAGADRETPQTYHQSINLDR